MPIYEYKCSICEATKEIVMRIKDTPPKTLECPFCKKQMNRIISRTSFVLKGKGWANDGYTK